MQVIILAAGMGKRLGELTQNNTKCMIRVNGVTLIERVLDQFSKLKLNKVIMVIGYKGEELRSFIGDSYKGLPIEYITNPIYDKTNNIYSLSLAKEQLQQDDTLLIESDLIFEDKVLDKILSDPFPNIALVAKYESWMDLVNPFFPSLKMKKEMRANFDILLSEYPSGLNVNSLLIAKYFGLAQQYVCPGNGAAELIKYLVDELTGCLGVVYPTFEEYPNRMQEDKVIAYVPQNKDFSYTADDLMAFFAVREVAAILLINPDNPSGNYISKVDVVHLAKWCKDKKVTLVVDESFVDFSEQSVDNTLLTNEILEENPNLVVVKSISKSYGVPGLRLGILASSNLLLIDRVRKNVPIWNINSFAEFYMQIFNKYEQDYKQACRLFIRERDRFYVDLQQIGYLRVIPSQANYFLCEVISKYSSKELTELLLNEYNILIKDCGTKKAFRNGEYIRIAVRSTLDNQRLIDALKEL